MQTLFLKNKPEYTFFMTSLASQKPFPRTMPPEQLKQIYAAALAAADPYQAVLNAVRLEGGQLQLDGAVYDLAAYRRIVVVGAGKATARMALAVEELLGERIAAGLIVVKEGHTAPLRLIEQAEASHPIPGKAGVEATQRVLQMVRAADAKTLVICLLSGGASALLVAPQAGVTLQDKQEVTALLLNAGATINELNAVRKHLSAVKGGRLARAAQATQMVTLILSDVIGDRLDVIASGPTVADSSTFAEAWAVIGKYALREKVPLRVMACMKRGIAGDIAETEKEAPGNVRNVIVAGIGQALATAQQQAQQLGYAVSVLSAKMHGEARDVAQLLAHTARATLAAMQAGERCCVLSGGETTVTVRGGGKGGRNQELALAFAAEIEGLAGASLLSAGTDGTDGPTDAAGAVVDGGTVARARQLGLQAEQYLADNDSYTYFQRLDAQSAVRSHLLTGPTGTNVMDLQIMLLEK